LKGKWLNNLSMSSTNIGPLLARVLEAQARQESGLRFPAISGYAAAVVRLTRAVHADLIWPVDVGGERLMGAIETVSRGDLTIRSWATAVEGKQVLLVATVTISGADLAGAAFVARQMGASAVHGCAFNAVSTISGIDTFTVLTADDGRMAWSA
jgi:hypothetical protein